MPSFDELQELANLVQPNKIKNLVLFGASEEPANKMDEFYRGLAQQKFKDDGEAAMAIYDNNFSESSYEKLKERLYQQLLNSLFFIDIHNKDFKENQIAYQECLRHTLAFRILLTRGKRKAAVSLAIKTLKKAQIFDYTDLIIMLARDLRTHYAGIVGNLKEFKKYDILIEKTVRIQAAELKAEKYYAECGAYFVQSNAMQKHLVQRMDSYSCELLEVLKTTQSFRLNFLSYLLFVMHAELTNNYARILKICKKA